MNRIFLTLAVFAVLLLVVNIVLGLRIGDYNGEFARYDKRGRKLVSEIEDLKTQRPRPAEKIEALRDQRRAEEGAFAGIHNRALVHILFGVAAALVAVLVNSISVTYFIGTGRWVREVVETYGFPREWIERCNVLKRRTFAAAMTGMLTAIGIIALGAAAHPGTIRAGTAAWVTPHMIGAILGTGLIAWLFYVQHGNITANFALLQRIVAEVAIVRREKGLDVEEDAAPVPAKPEFLDQVTR